jgi:hypothetical protein
MSQGIGLGLWKSLNLLWRDGRNDSDLPGSRGLIVNGRQLFCEQIREQLFQP